MMHPAFLPGSYPVAIFLSLLFWLIFPRRARFIFLLPAFLPLTALLVFLLSGTSQSSEITLPFLQASDRFSLEIRFQFDHLRLGLALLVSLLSFLIQLYSLSYLKKEDSQGYFHFLIGLFQLAMCGLFLSASLFSLFLFWELVGILSWLLVQFWYGKPAAADSALRVVLINKAGDFFLLTGIGLLVSFGLFFPVSVNMVLTD